MKINFIVGLLMGVFIFASALAADRYPFASAAEAQRFDHLIQQFRCLVCQNEDLASSNASLANDLRQQVYEMVKAGKSDTDITNFMVNRYGDFVLFKPPFVRQTVFIWLLPFLLLLIGFVIFYVVIRKYSIKNQPQI